MAATVRSPDDALSTAQISAASGFSVQQIRDLERVQAIPPAERAQNGYRRFSAIHVIALRAYRNLAVAIGPVEARRVMRQIRALPLDRAVALINGLHVTLAVQRERALAAERALEDISAEAFDDTAAGPQDVMTITELAAALGVRASTLRFWESVGLISPERVTRLAARRYPVSAIREARIVAALRSAGYRIPDIQNLMRSIRDVRNVGDTSGALRARVQAIARQMCALLTAGTDIVTLLTDGG
jgi:DNA-binding transcriptional MerR regulator